jgi:hypothetical protein
VRLRATLGLLLVLVGLGATLVWALPRVERTIRQLAQSDRAALGGVAAPRPTARAIGPHTTHRRRQRQSLPPGDPSPNTIGIGRAHVPTRRPSGASSARSLVEALLLLRVVAALTALLLGALAVSRLWARRRRVYALYELHLSLQDEAPFGRVMAMVRQIGGTLRTRPGERLVRGQPFVAFESIAVSGPTEVRWRIGVRCEPRAVRAIEAHIRGCYPDVRLGRVHDEPPTPLDGRMQVPRHLLRLSKAKTFVLALGGSATAEGQEGPPLKHLATVQTALRHGSVVRLQIAPAPIGAELLARAAYRRREASRGGERDRLEFFSPLTRQEMTSAEETQNQALFWLEAQICCNDREECWRLAQGLAAERGANRLQVRHMLLRTWLYRRRFPRGLPPMFRSASLRSLVSTAELAHLLELPSAAMKGVAVRRNAVPRLPADTDARRAGELRSRWTTSAHEQTANHRAGSGIGGRHDPALGHEKAVRRAGP